MQSAPACLAGQYQRDTTTTSPVDFVTTYCNPLNVYIADPFVLTFGGKYYLYGTTNTRDLEVYESTDLVHWKLKGTCYSPGPKSWGKVDVWAPEVAQNGSKFYLYFSARQRKEKQRNICVAVSDSPLGPFTDLKAPLFPDLSVIDGHVFHDPATGDRYIYAVDEHQSPSRILAAKLKPDMVTLETTLTTVLKPSMPWEDYWNEAPFVIRHGSTYYMMYSGSAFWEPGYSIGYAEAPSPLGPFVKFKGNPILKQTASVDGPGHNAVAMSPDGREMFIVYHTHEGHWTTDRVLAIDRVKFIKGRNGHEILTVPGGASSTDQPLPSGVPPRLRAQSDSFNSKSRFANWYIIQEEPRSWALTSGALNISMANGDFWRSHSGGENLFLQDVPNGDFAISTKATFARPSEGAQASLIVWGDPDNFVMFGPGMVSGEKYVLSAEDQQKNDTNLFPPGRNPSGKVRIECHDQTLSFFTENKHGKWSRLKKKVHIRFKPQYVGLGAWNTNHDDGTTASFDSFNVRPLP